MFAVISIAREGFSYYVLCHFFDTLSPFPPIFLKKSTNPPARNVLSLTGIDFCFLHFEQNSSTTNTLLLL